MCVCVCVRFECPCAVVRRAPGVEKVKRYHSKNSGAKRRPAARFELNVFGGKRRHEWAMENSRLATLTIFRIYHYVRLAQRYSLILYSRMQILRILGKLASTI